MALTMATINIRGSTTASHAPSAGQLALYEVAVNITDQLLYVGAGTSSPAVLMRGPPGPTGPAGPPGPPGPPG